MARHAIRRAALTGALILLAGIFLPAETGPSSPETFRARWVVKMTVSVKGTYELESRSRASGRYAMKIAWTGGLEWDGDDYILLKGKGELAEWTAEESATTPGGIRILTTDDFDEIPELNVAYALMHGGGLHLSFVIRGFGVPRSFPNNQFYLHLPASAENEERPDGANYNHFVASGSNAIVLDDPALAEGTQEKTFRWTWVRRSAATNMLRGFFETNRHEAEVTVVVSPVK